jgi:integrase
MASIFKPEGKAKYVIVYTDENGRRRKKTGTADKTVTHRIARDIENRVALRREGIVDPCEEAYARHAAQTLGVHVAAWIESLRSRGVTPQHVKLHSSRAMRVVALFKGADLTAIEPAKPATREGVARAEAELRRWVASARLSELTAESVQKALARLRGEGRSLQTCNHHRNAIKSFAKWLRDTHRVREDLLRGVAGFNASEDPRHERRTVSLDELRRLIEAAETGSPFKSMAGPMRALCYRLAVASGLRYSEIGSITPGSFDWTSRPATVTIRAAYAKNGQTATLPLADDLAADLNDYVAQRPPGSPLFPLPHDKGAAMVRRDLEAAGIPYRDAAGRVFDFHSLRCELATLADSAGISPRVVQRLMRHSKLEMTGRYTRPRAVDIEAAASLIPSLKPEADRPEALAMTGTDPAPVQPPRATQGATRENDPARNPNAGFGVMSMCGRNVNPLVVGSSPTPVTRDRNRPEASKGSDTKGLLPIAICDPDSAITPESDRFRPEPSPPVGKWWAKRSLMRSPSAPKFSPCGASWLVGSDGGRWANGPSVPVAASAVASGAFPGGRRLGREAAAPARSCMRGRV